MNKRKRIAIIFGGKSVEHEVSLRSAKNIIDNLDPDLFEAVLIGIDHKGSWYHLKEHTFHVQEGDQLGIRLSQDKENIFLLETGESIGEIDMVFPILHGNDGEDGSIQGLFHTLDIPFVGTGVLGSSVAFDKICSKKLLDNAGIPNARYMTLFIEEKDTIDFESVKMHLGSPVFIKPVASGSSVGVFKVDSSVSFQKAIHESFQYDNVLLLEEFIEGREIECAVMGNDKIEVSLPGEIRIIGKHDFYSFDAKYVDDKGAALDMPADLPDNTVKEIQELAKLAYQCLFCEDFARVDMFLTKKGTILINEINTIPGFTHISMFPQLWTLSGISYKDLITLLIDMAFEKHRKQSRVKRDYKSALS
jgi:D-alanine-D-alanine ligase